MAPTIELREITKDSLAAVLDLAVEPEQEQYVATNARSRSRKPTSSRRRGFVLFTPMMLRLGSSWSMEGNLVGSDEKNIKGETEFRWLPGGFFLEQRVWIDFMGQQIDSLELIGYDPETDTFPSTVFSGFSPTPLPYRWEVRGDTVTITVSYGPLDSSFTGSWREDGTFSGGWRPNPGADETVNIAYDIGGHRLE